MAIQMHKLLKQLYGDWKAKELLLGTMVAVMLVSFYHSRNVDAENFALGPQNTSPVEQWQGKHFTAHSPLLIKRLVEEFSDSVSADAYWLWLGNSQLHTINQKKDGDHLAPYWLRQGLACSKCSEPIGVSMPNANLQEYLVLERYLEQRLPIRGIIVSLVFDDLREDGIRNELLDLLDGQVEADLGQLAAGRTILQSIKQSAQKGGALNMNPAGGGEKDFQKRLERALETDLGYYFPLWNDRSHLKAIFTIDLYYVRNWLLNIEPTTVRKIIEPRYERNMQALRDLLGAAQREGRDVLVYIVPIRQDLPLPYDMKRYEQWKQVVERLAHDHGARFLNLETLVPPEHWGTYHNDDVDFMHFQGPGHQLLAKEILKQIGG